MLGATDRRIRSVVAQVPTISGYEQSRRRVHPEEVSQLEDNMAADDRQRYARQPPAYQRVVSIENTDHAVYRSPDACAFYTQPLAEGTVWENSVTVRSTRAAYMYEPGHWVSRVSPTPLLMIVALKDTVTPTDMGLTAYEHALYPKKLETFRGGHFDAYTKDFDQVSSAARDWFIEHLTQHRCE